MSIYTDKIFFNNFDGEYPAEMTTLPTGKKGAKIKNDPTKHYPNKPEAQLLRKIMASTGLSEEEIRADFKYRKQLSEAQKAGQKAKRDEVTKFYQGLIKEACKETGLAPQHPETLKALDKIIKEREGRCWGRRFYLRQNLKSAEAIVKQYAK